jgi:hypothetical protein
MAPVTTSVRSGQRSSLYSVCVRAFAFLLAIGATGCWFSKGGTGYICESSDECDEGLRCYGYVSDDGDPQNQCQEPGEDSVSTGYTAFAVYMSWCFWVLMVPGGIVFMIVSSRRQKKNAALAAPQSHVSAAPAAAPSIQLVLQLRLDGWGSGGDLAMRHELEARVGELLVASQNGACDGGDIGSGTANIFCVVRDVDRAIAAITPELAKRGLADRSVIAVQRGEDYAVRWPPGYDRPFSIL